LSAPAQTALRKIEAKYGKSVVTPPAELSGLVRLQAHDVSLPILLRAAREKRVIKFNYQNRSGTQSARRIEPWAVICREGHWYCIGFDLDRNEQRTFKLPRIQGNVTLSSETHTAPRPDNPSMQIPQLDEQITAQITVVPNRGAMLRRNASSVKHNAVGDRLTVHGSLSDVTRWTLIALADVLRIESLTLTDSVSVASERIQVEHLAVSQGGRSHG
jgi:predicted DNA-binding transcriptional regulator YafY